MAKKKVTKPKGHFIEGALIGAALAVAAGVFANSKTGKKLGKEVKKNLKMESGQFYKYIAPKLKQASKMSEAQYKAFIKRAITSYGKSRKLSVEEIANLIKWAEAMGKHLRKKLK